MVIYSIQPLLFNYNLMNTTMGMAETNIMWNVTSSVIVTIIGVYYFNETIEYNSMLGIVFGIIAIILLNYKKNAPT